MFTLARKLEANGGKLEAVAGLRGTGDWGTDERPKNFREMILWRDPNGEAPLTALSAKMRKDPTDDPEFNWWEEDLGIIRLTTTGTTTTGQTTINFIPTDDAQLLAVSDVCLVEKTEATGAYTNEFVKVSAIASATQITATRGVANTTAATIASGTNITRIGSAFGEGTTSPDAASKNPTKYSNYCQIHKTSYRLTNTAKKTYARTGDALKNDKKRKMFDHAVGIEWTGLFGKPFETTDSNGKPLRYSGGFLHYAVAAYTAGFTHCHKVWTTTPTEDELLEAVYKIWNYNAMGAGNERIVFCGNGFLNSLNKLARNSSSTQIKFEDTIRVYGMELKKWVFPQGNLYFRTHPVLNRHGRYTSSAMILNPAGIRWRSLRDRDTKMEDNIQAPDADEQKGQWITEVGFEFNHMPTMAYLGNFVV